MTTGELISVGLGLAGIAVTIVTWHTSKKRSAMASKKRTVRQTQHQDGGEVQIQKQRVGDIQEIQGQRGGNRQEQSQEVTDDE